MSKKVTVYTRNNCAYCVQVKRYLDIKKQDYDVINLDENPSEEASVVAKSGARTVPIVMITNEKGDELIASIGWNPGALSSALAA
ncbi:glutaredoxin family protein [Candidatus Saccharibacteria bacterium]|nr:glutaredoxin family protein [Candidatus Saccharibacteria bacterium]NCU40225.1 glutaredoxin family protein [Candidatus Saccharibacteria bacterium]